MNLKDYINTIPDFPKKGILYRDIQPLLAHPEAFKNAVYQMAQLIPVTPDFIVGIESRGFVFATALAMHLNCGIKLVRKKGKLPNANLVSEMYALEYGTDTLEMVFSESKNQTCVLVDDVLATGGTLNAAEKVVEKAGYVLLGKLCLLDIGLIQDKTIQCIIRYES
jgi:adenine phosphoribosyltransferase